MYTCVQGFLSSEPDGAGRRCWLSTAEAVQIQFLSQAQPTVVLPTMEVTLCATCVNGPTYRLTTFSSASGR